MDHAKYSNLQMSSFGNTQQLLEKAADVQLCMPRVSSQMPLMIARRCGKFWLRHLGWNKSAGDCVASTLEFVPLVHLH